MLGLKLNHASKRGHWYHMVDITWWYLHALDQQHLLQMGYTASSDQLVNIFKIWFDNINSRCLCWIRSQAKDNSWCLRRIRTKWTKNETLKKGNWWVLQHSVDILQLQGYAHMITNQTRTLIFWPKLYHVRIKLIQLSPNPLVSLQFNHINKIDILFIWQFSFNDVSFLTFSWN